MDERARSLVVGASAGGVEPPGQVLGEFPPDLPAAVTVVLHRGRVVAQDEATCQHFGMPGAAILAGGVDEILSLEDIAPAVIEFAARSA